jgi:hypothetical protein
MPPKYDLFGFLYLENIYNVDSLISSESNGFELAEKDRAG